MTLPEYKPLLDEAFDAMMEHGTPYDVRYKIRRQNDGEIVDIHSIMELDPEGRTVFGIVHDYSEQAKVVEELRESRMKLENAMDLAKLAQWEYDTSAGMFHFNERFYAILGTTAEREGGSEISAGEYARRFLPEDDAHLVATTIKEGEKALREGRPSFSKRIDHDIIRGDGERRSVSVILHGMRDEASGLAKVDGLIQDVTDRRRIEASLRLANTRLELLNSIARHDISNQVMVLSGNLKMMRVGNNDPKVARRIERMEGATQDILGRLELMGTQASRSDGPIWQDLEKLVRGLPVADDVENLDMNDGVHGLEILADPMFRIVMHNLLEDSVKYANEPTTVRISAVPSEKGLLLVYEDVGAGIPLKEKGSVFDRQGVHTSGIGLPLCKEILAESGISIREIGTPGRGVRFEMVVPPGHYRSG